MAHLPTMLVTRSTGEYAGSSKYVLQWVVRKVLIGVVPVQPLINVMKTVFLVWVVS
jgi:hypothetical protein